MSHRPFKNKVYAEFARVGLALGSDKRLELLDLLAQGPRYVDGLAAEMEMSVANVSQHLQVLRNAKLVESNREGTRVLYSLADETVLHLWLNLRSIAEERLPEVRLLREQFEPEGPIGEMSRAELESALSSDRVLLIDVRPATEFQSGHIEGAVSLPVEELPDRISTLPKDKTIVAYCRGEYCLFADEAVALLLQNGFNAVRLDGGWPEWRAEDRPRS